MSVSKVIDYHKNMVRYNDYKFSVSTIKRNYSDKQGLFLETKMQLEEVPKRCSTLEKLAAEMKITFYSNERDISKEQKDFDEIAHKAYVGALKEDPYHFVTAPKIKKALKDAL